MADEVPLVLPEEAIRFFRNKGLQLAFAWQDVWQGEHARAFTVAKAMTRDVLETIREAVDRAIAEGETLDDFRKALTPRLQEAGWWGRKDMRDPLTGEVKNVQLGSPRRLKTIFDVNMRSAYAAGRWERIQRNKKAFPFLRYMTVDDFKVRPEHHAWHGTIRPVDDAFWNTHYPPCGWHCRCQGQPVNQRTMDRRGWMITDKPAAFPMVPYTNPRTGEVTMVEKGIAPGFAFNVGKSYLGTLAPNPMGDGIETDDIAAAGDGDQVAIRAFLSAFPAGQGRDLEGSRIVTGPDGWPLAIGPAWFRGPDGIVRLPTGRRRGQLARVGRAIADPDEVRLRWVRAAGRPGEPPAPAMLMRRYIRQDRDGAVVVDVGRGGWRFVGDFDRGFRLERYRSGVVTWSREGADVAARQYHRDRLGRFAHGGTGGLFGATFDRAHAEPHWQGVIELGPVGRPAPASVHGYARRVLADDLRHVIKQHGDPAREAARGQAPITRDDIVRIPRIISSAHKVELVGDPKSRRGQSLRFTAKVDGHEYTIAETVGHARRQVMFKTMWKKRPQG